MERFQRSVRQTGQGVAQVDPGINPKLLTSGGEAGQDGQGISALIRAKEEPVFSADGEGLHRPLGNIVVDGQFAIPGVNLQGFPLMERV